MKNTKVLLLVLIIIFSLIFVSACSTSNENDVPINEHDSVGDVSQSETTESETAQNEKSQSETTDVDTLIKSEVTVEPKVLLDQDGIIITLKSLNIDDLFGPALKILVENGSDKSVTIQIRNAAINDVMIENIFSCDVVAGKNANDEIIFMQSDLDAAGIETIKDIEFKFQISDTETWDTVFDTNTINITTSADPSYVQTYDDSGFIALNQNGYKVVIKKIDNEDSSWGADIYVYLENNNEINTTIQVRDVSINGFMMEPIFSCDIVVGKKAYDSITFLESDLIDNDITSIDEMELAFHIFDEESWDTAFDSETITVTFGE